MHCILMRLAKFHCECPSISYIYNCILTCLVYGCLKKLGFFMVADRQLTHRKTQKDIALSSLRHCTFCSNNNLWIWSDDTYQYQSCTMNKLTFSENVTRCLFTKQFLIREISGLFMTWVACCVDTHIQEPILYWYVNAFDWNLSMCSSECNTLTMW